jgi:hypothetical protein
MMGQNETSGYFRISTARCAVQVEKEFWTNIEHSESDMSLSFSPSVIPVPPIQSRVLVDESNIDLYISHE